MSFGPLKVFSSVLTSGGTSCTATFDKAYGRVYVQVPTMSTAATLAFYGSADGTSYYPFMEQAQTATIQWQQITVATTVVSGGAVFPVPAHVPYVKLETGATVGNGMTVKFICSD